jgi:radical SAM-linked protein
VSTAGTRRLRFRYAKAGKIRFTSQRDVARMWERALRRSGLPVAWSEGFSPRPLLSFGLALPTGCESLGEYLDVRVEPGGRIEPDPAVLAAQLSELLPEGIDVQAAAGLEGVGGSLQQEVTSCNWEMEVRGVLAEELATRVGRLLGSPSVPIRRERKGRPVEDDLRPAVLSLALLVDPVERTPAGGTAGIEAELATHPRGVRPKELLEGLGTDLVLVRACRTHQWIERDGSRWEPLDPDGHLPPGADAPHAQERAS